MKKLLLSFVMILSFAAMAYADVVTWDFVNNDYGLERQSGNSTKYLPSETVITNGDSQIELTKGGGNGFRLWADGIRFMKVTEANWAKMAVRIPGGKISKDKTHFFCLCISDIFITALLFGINVSYDFCPVTNVWISAGCIAR